MRARRRVGDELQSAGRDYRSTAEARAVSACIDLSNGKFDLVDLGQREPTNRRERVIIFKFNCAFLPVIICRLTEVMIDPLCALYAFSHHVFKLLTDSRVVCHGLVKSLLCRMDK